MNIAKSLLEVLQEAGTIGNAPYGSLQVYNESLHHLQLLAHYGYNPVQIQLFQFVRPGGTTASARAFALGKRVIVPNVHHDPFYLPYLAVATTLGYQAVQATPILTHHNQVLGVLTTNFARPYYPTRADTAVWDKCAERTARLVKNFWIYQVWR